MFKVESVRDKRFKRGRVEYLIKWEGYARYVAIRRAHSSVERMPAPPRPTPPHPRLFPTLIPILSSLFLCTSCSLLCHCSRSIGFLVASPQMAARVHALASTLPSPLALADVASLSHVCVLASPSLSTLSANKP
eukprot:6177172-Pleurochrysis_carterae.AAC.2